MSPAFRISLGISAIDCLLSAFVAILILCLSLLGEQTDASASAKVMSLLIRVHKSTLDGSPMQVQLALSLYDHTGKNRLYDGLQTVGKSPGGMHQLQLSDDMKARAGLMPGGTIGWLDCNRPQPDCTAQLLVRDVDPDKCLVMRLIPVTTTTRFREEYPPQIRITPALPNSTAIPPKLLSLSGFGSERELRFVVRFADNNPVLEYGTSCSSP